MMLTGCDLRATERESTHYAELRQKMVRQQLQSIDRSIVDARVLAAIGKVPRHEFVPAEVRAAVGWRADDCSGRARERCAGTRLVDETRWYFGAPGDIVSSVCTDDWNGS